MLLQPSKLHDPLEGQPLEHAEKTRVLGLLQVVLQPEAPAGTTPTVLRRRAALLDISRSASSCTTAAEIIGKVSGPISTQAVLAPAGEIMFGWQPQAAGSVPPPH